jgi:hypothetical protein
VPTKLAPIVAPADPARAHRHLQAAMLEVLAELRTMLDGPDQALEEVGTAELVPGAAH